MSSSFAQFNLGVIFSVIRRMPRVNFCVSVAARTAVARESSFHVESLTASDAGAKLAN